MIITVTGGNLFALASIYLGDPTQWGTLATLNSIQDPWLNGVNALFIPVPHSIPRSASGS